MLPQAHGAREENSLAKIPLVVMRLTTPRERPSFTVSMRETDMKFTPQHSLRRFVWEKRENHKGMTLMGLSSFDSILSLSGQRQRQNFNLLELR